MFCQECNYCWQIDCYWEPKGPGDIPPCEKDYDLDDYNDVDEYSIY